MLKFYAKADQLVTVPGSRPVVGQPPKYIGRSFDRDSLAFPATEEGFTCESESDRGRRLTKLTRRDSSLWAANGKTAAHCGVPFVQLEFADGVWVRQSRRHRPKKTE